MAISIPRNPFMDDDKTDPADRAFIAHKLAEDARIKEEQRKFFGDPANVEKLLSHTMRQAVPEKKLAKLPMGSPLAKLEAAIPEGDPRKNIGSSVLEEVTQNIPNLPRGMHPAAYIAESLKKQFGEKTEDIYKYIQKEESSLPFFKTEVAGAPGYEEWKKEFLAQTDPEGGVAGSFVKGAAVGTGMELVGRQLVASGAKFFGSKLLAGALMTTPATAPVGLAIGVASTAMGAADVLTSLVQKTEWARQRPWKSMGVELLGALGIFKGVGKGAEALAKKATAVGQSFKESMDVLTTDPSAKNLVQSYNVSIAKNRVEQQAAALTDAAANRTLTRRMSDMDEAQTAKIEGLFKELGAEHGLAEQDAAALYVRDRQKQGVNLSRTLLNKVGVLQKVEDTGRVKALVQEGMSLEDAAIHVVSEETALKTYYPDIAKSLGLTEGIPEIAQYVPSFKKVAKELGLADDVAFNMIKTKSPMVEILANRPDAAQQYQKTVATIEKLAKEMNVIPRTAVNAFEDLTPNEMADVDSIFRRVPGLSRADYVRGIGADTQAAKSKIDLAGKAEAAKKIPTAEEKAEGLFQAAKDNKDIQKKIGLMREQGFLSPEEDAGYTRRMSEYYNKKNPEALKKELEGDYLDVTKHVSDLIGDDPTFKTEAGSKLGAFLRQHGKTIIGTGGLIITAITGSLGLDITDNGLEFVGSAEAYNPLGRIAGQLAKAAEGTTQASTFAGLKEAGLIARKAGAKDLEVADDMIQRAVVVDTTKVTPTYTKRLPFYLDSILSASVLGQVRYGIQKGVEKFTDPVRQLASHLTAATNNTGNYAQVFNNIMEQAGVKSNWKAVRETMAPIEAKYSEDIAHAGYAKDRIGVYKDLLKKKQKEITKSLSKDEEQALLDPMLDFESKIKDFETSLGERAPKIAEYQKEAMTAYQDLSSKFASTRIALAAEDDAVFTKYPWLKDMMKPEELVATARLKKMNEGLALRIIDAGEKPIMESAYMHHAIHPDRNWKSLQESFSNVSDDAATALRLAGLHSRTIGSMQMMPDAHYVMQRYLPDINRRLEIMEFWGGIGKKAADGTTLPTTGWAAHKESQIVQNNDGLRKFWESINRSFDPQERTTTNKWASRLYDFEISRLLALSPSVSFKHAIKLEANWSNFGFLESMKLLPKTAYRWSRSALTQKGFGEEIEDEAVRSFTNQHNLMQVVSDLDTQNIPEAAWDGFMKTFNQKGGVFINAVERFDRGHSVIAAVHMAAKKGMTPAQAAYGVMDTILKTNFLSGPLNPAWLRDPKIRMLFMFQGTPFKILEQRVLLAMRAGGNIAETAKGMWQSLTGIRNDVKEGEHLLKWSLMKEALLRDKDIFGTASTQQMMRKLVILGTGVAAGKQIFDIDLLAHVSHPPFLKFEDKQIGLNINPAMSAAWQSWNAKESDDKDLWIAEFAKQWLREGPIQQNFIKAARISRDDIPARYRDSKLKYLFGVPAAKED